jgi:hypothetical protein
MMKAALLAAVHMQPPPVVTETLPVPPAIGKLWLVGIIVKVKQSTPDCVTVKVLPAIVIVPIREPMSPLAATE